MSPMVQLVTCGSREVSKFSQKNFVIAAMLVEKPSVMELCYVVSQSVRISRIEEQRNGSLVVSLECP